MSLEDKKLVSAAQHDPDSYDALYEKYSRYVYLYVWQRVGGNKETAEDLMQETFVRAFGSLPRYQDKGYSYASYLIRIAHNLLVNYYRKSKPVYLPHPEWLSNAPTGDIDEIEYACDSLLLWEAMKDIPINEQNALILFYWDDMSVRQVAGRMNKSENAVKLLLSRGRKRLAKHDLFQGYGTAFPKRLRELENDACPPDAMRHKK